MNESILKRYEQSKEIYRQLGVNTDKAIKALSQIPISVNCWQGDDVAGFEKKQNPLSGGIAATGNYPGAAQTPEQLKQDIDFAFANIPGKLRLNLHASYLVWDTFVERDALEPEHFDFWVHWAKEKSIGLDFNPTFFAHPNMDNGLTLSHPDKKIQNFWIEHLIRCRKISAHFGKQLGSPSKMNIWIPDGYKDIPVDRLSPRQRLMEALDIGLEQPFSKKHHIDAVESKLFGIGSESYVVGSHEFYMGYAMKKNIGICLDTGHFHPTETISNKISALSLYVKDILLHVSRPVRWDSDHVVIMENELVEIATEIVRNQLTKRVHIGLDYFDASINRLAAWIIGTRNVSKALLMALLEPTTTLKNAEKQFDFTTCLAIMEEMKSYPWQGVWDYYCAQNNAPVGLEWLNAVQQYEKTVLYNRSTGGK